MKISLLALPLALAAGASGLPFDLHPPAWVERWLYNPRERTEQAIDAYEEGQAVEAAELAETALRLATADAEQAQLAYNAGTAQLAAGEPGAAGARLEEAVAALEAQAKSGELAPRVHYNLGNARLAADDAAGAVEAFEQSLRLDPDNADAKFNLELALRALEEQQRQEGSSPQESPEGESPGQEESSEGPGPDRPPDPNQEQEPSDDSQSAPPEDRPDQQEGRDPPPQPEPRLPDFENQPDMSAAEAAAILEAVENLERQQRRAQAQERSRQRAAGGKDW